ncbi:MAG: flagellar protein FliT [Peptococcaceae bacterium]|nr:flagellar protein FliT [Peptococcaceae bacterium]
MSRESKLELLKQMYRVTQQMVDIVQQDEIDDAVLTALFEQRQKLMDKIDELDATGSPPSPEEAQAIKKLLQEIQELNASVAKTLENKLLKAKNFIKRLQKSKKALQYLPRPQQQSGAFIDKKK